MPPGPDPQALAGIKTDSKAIERLQTSLNAIKGQGPVLAAVFYRKLFDRYPGVRPLFPVEMAGQEKKLFESLVVVVDHLREPQRVVAILRELGRKHAQYGAKPEHYPAVCAALVEAMAEAAGPTWSAQLQSEWTQALQLVSTIMIQGAEAPPATAGR